MGEREDLEEALRKQRAVLAHLEAQAAGFGSLHVPAHIMVEIDDARANIAGLERQIGTLPATEPPTTSHDHERLAQLEAEIEASLHFMDQTKFKLSNEHDPRKIRRLENNIKKTQRSLNQIYDDYLKAGGDLHKYSI